MKIGKAEVALAIVTAVLLSVLMMTRTGGHYHGNTAKGAVTPTDTVPKETGMDTVEEDLPLNATAFLQKARLLYAAQNFEEAYGKYNVAVIYAFIDGETENEYLAHKGRADCAFLMWEIDTCIYSYNKAVQLTRELGNPMEEYQVYMQLRQAYTMKMDMKKASLMEQKMDSLQSALKDKSIVVDRLCMLSDEALWQQQLKVAEQYALKAEKLIGSFSSTDRNAAEMAVWERLRNIYHAARDYEKARRYSKQYTTTVKRAFGKTQFAYLKPYYAEVLICSDQQDRKGAFAALDSMAYGLTLKDGASVRNNVVYHYLRGVACAKFGDWEQAASSYGQALTEIKGTALEGGTDEYEAVAMLGGALFQMGKYDEAEGCYNDFAAFCRYQFGEVSMQYSNALSSLAEVERCRESLEEGKRYYAEAVDIFMKIVREQLCFVSPLERNAFWASFAPKMWAMTRYAMSTGECASQFTEQCYDALLFSKALLLEVDRSMLKEIEAKCSKEEQNVYYEMLNLQGQLKYLTNDYEKNRDRITALYKKISALNQQMVPIASKLNYTSFLDQNYHDIQKELDKSEVLLDFADYIDENEDHQHVAFVVDNAQRYPKLVKSFTEQELKLLLMGRGKEALYMSPLAEKALKLFWEPFEKDVRGKTTVYYVPSGDLHQIAIESIPMPDGSLLGDHYRFVRLTSAREIANVKRGSQVRANTTAVLFGGLKYDMDAALMAKEASAYKIERPIAMNRGNVARGNKKFGDLPGTLEEIEKIGDILKRNGVSVRPQTGTKGTEEAFLSLNGQAPGILHVATHGFYYTPEDAKEVTYLNGYNDAMMLSGLILSGANLAWTGKTVPSGVLGGVLTANEIATMNLKGTNLVVLSACQTGLGMATPEGLYGLQRAFKKAGVQTIVMSLWGVNDKATKEFMVKFYEELAGSCQWDKRKAFDEAKKHIKNNPEYKGDPYYWAGFVMLD